MQNAATAPWLVGQVPAYREKWASEGVAKAGGLFYFPQHIEATRRTLSNGRRERVFRQRPLFPGYLFINPLDRPWQAFARAQGIFSILGAERGIHPSTISDAEIQVLKAQERDGVVVLPKSVFAPGQSVNITSGAFSGFAGIVQGLSSRERVQVLLEYMNRRVSFLVEEKSLEAA